MMISEVSPAARSVTFSWEIDSPSPSERVQEMLMWIDRGCHTLSSLRQPVPIFGRAQLNGQETPFESRPFSPQ